MNKKLTMLSSHEGSPDGRRVQWYLAGQTYDVSESLSAIFLKEKWAVDADSFEGLPVAEAPKAELAAAAAPGHKQEYSDKKHRRK
jgi:hypothetical protein